MLKRILRAFFGGDLPTARTLHADVTDVRMAVSQQQPPTPSLAVRTSAAMNFWSARSPNGAYVLTWHDADRDAGVGGHRETGHGGYQRTVAAPRSPPLSAIVWGLGPKRSRCAHDIAPN